MGFSSFDKIVSALTVLGDTGDIEWSKTTAQTSALAAGSYHDLFLGGDEPAAVTLPTGSNAFVEVSGNNGSPTHNGIVLANPAASKTRHALYLEALANTSNGQGDLYVEDLLGFYADFNLATGGTQSTADVAQNRTSRYSKGCFCYLVTQVAFTGTPPSVVVNATDQNGSAVASPSLSLTGGSALGRVPTAVWRVPFPGVSNIRNVRSLAFTGGAAPTGKVAVMLARKLATAKMGAAFATERLSLADPRGALLLPRLVDNVFLNLVYRPASTPTTPRLTASLSYVDGQNPS